MKLFKETHNEDADLAVIQFGGGTICTVEPIEITEEEIGEAADEHEKAMCGASDHPWLGDYVNIDFTAGVSWALSKFKGDDTECPECLGLGEYSDEHRRNIVCDNCSGTGNLKERDEETNS